MLSRPAYLVLLVAFIVGLTACAPKATPSTPSPVAPTTPRPTATLGPSSPTPTSADVAWAKTVEAAKKEGKVVVLGYSFRGDIGTALAKAFGDKYGTQLEFVTGTGAEMVEKIKTEARTGNITEDVAETAAAYTLALKNAGLTVSSKDIPVLSEKGVWQVDPLTNDSEGHLLAHEMALLLPLYNTNLVKASDIPTSYKDLTLSKWKGQFGLIDPSVSAASDYIFTTLQGRGFIDPDTIKAIGLNSPKFYIGSPTVATAVAQGAISLGLVSQDGDAAPFFKSGAPVRPFDMTEGTIANISSAVRIKGSPHPNAALLFLNWIISQEGQTILCKALGSSSVRSDVPDGRPVEGRLVPTREIPLTIQELANASASFQAKRLATLWGRKGS